MPALRAFRALRYDATAVPDLATVICPPYDVISVAEGQRLRARDPHNAVRLELPEAVEGADPDDRYRSAARAIADWRSKGVLRKDRVPTLTIHEMTSRAPGSDRETVSRGVLARLKLEPFGPSAGVRPHERTMSGPKEDRFRILRATGTNLSPVVLLHEADPDATTAVLQRLTDRPADAEAHADDGVLHRLWVCPGPDGHDDETGSPKPSPTDAEADTAQLMSLLTARPLTIADGHHRYETALRYRDERGRNRACESDPAWDYVLALIYAIRDAPTVLPTHRVVADGPSGEALLDAAARLFTVERLTGPDQLLERMAAEAPDPRTTSGEQGSGRLGLWTGGIAALLEARPDAFDALLDPAASHASQWLDVNLLALAMERLMGVDAPALAAGGRLTYTKDAGEAIDLVSSGRAASAFLLHPTPVAAITAVAAAGEVMPQKSTYFHPKAPTGLLFAPLEW